MNSKYERRKVQLWEQFILPEYLMSYANNDYVVYVTMLDRSPINIFKKNPINNFVGHKK